jgi:hypothetical protein
MALSGLGALGFLNKPGEETNAARDVAAFAAGQYVPQ